MKFFKVYLENAGGDQICMTATAQKYMISEIDGLCPPTAVLSTAGYAGTDGSYLTNAYIDKRNIVITFYMSGVGDTEQRRQELYSVVQPSKYIKMYYYTRRRKVYAEGYVESMTISNFVSGVNGQISILCPDLYWHGVEAATYSTADSETDVTANFYYTFPNSSWYTNDDGYEETQIAVAESTAAFESDTVTASASLTIDNDGDEYGFVMRLINGNEHDANFDKIIITNETAGQTMTIDYSEYGYVEIGEDGGYLVIDTIAGEKDIHRWSHTGIDKGSYMRYFDFSVSDWLTLVHGENVITVTVTVSTSSYTYGVLETLSFEIDYQPVYLGV